MVRQRSILSLILVLLTTFLISCGSPSVATAPPTYTPTQLVKIQEYVPDIQVVRDRSQELQTLIQSGEWIKVGNFIHGPMTEARLNMTYVIPNLLPQDQPKGRQITKDLLSHLVKIDQAASGGNTSQALSAYKDAFADVDKFLQLIPE
ncbi:photosystem II protein PsbQ [Sphaerospermopsis torques-reginae]|jgi:photosystem II protein PsbQ|uniref:Photosystem II protein PsbQ n=1 Tax=Sphaerospermopsis torques-reginae ITEP-024 TaxID=984208 RepID=A0ABX8WYV0_9CYAN|nr:photosystem II protein PsbQ [Sphaerospermopsis torques-reginae]QYX31565.1 photosystem II protein PsbQ [Sphaerospermopsis torques-reginae ITEP-024]